MAFNIDHHMSRLNERVMSCAQHSLDELGYVLDEMEMAVENNPEREDIKACLDELKEKSKKALTECWAAANHWSDHFDGLGKDDTGEEADKTEKDADDSDSDEE